MIDLKEFKEMVKRVRLTTSYDSHAKIAKKLGCNARYFSGVLSGRMPLSGKFVDKFFDKFPDVQEVHIETSLSGKDNSPDMTLPREVFDMMKAQIETINSQQRVMEQLVSLINFREQFQKNKKNRAYGGDEGVFNGHK